MLVQQAQFSLIMLIFFFYDSVGPTSFEISQRDDGKAQVNTDWVVLGDIIADYYISSQ